MVSSSISGVGHPKAVHNPKMWKGKPSMELPRVSLYSRHLDLPKNARGLIKLYQKLCERTGADSCLVVYQGQIIVSDYDNSCAVHTAASMMSSTKSVTSILFGIMRDKGWLQVDDPVSKHIPRWNQGIKAEVTLKHLLTCTGGFPFVPIARRGVDGVEIKDDRNRFVENLEPQFRPGEQCIYNDEGVQLLGSVMSRMCREKERINLQEFAQKYLFEPLGMHPNTQFEPSNIGDVLVSAHMKALPTDFVKFGQLMLNGGEWNGKRIVSPEWIQQSAREHQRIGYAPYEPVSGKAPFGYLWWPDPTIGSFSARGFLDNSMHIIPSAKLIMQRTHFLRHPRKDCMDWYKARDALVKKNRMQVKAAKEAGEQWMPNYTATSRRIFKRLAQIFPRN